MVSDDAALGVDSDLAILAAAGCIQPGPQPI
jgi:predicted metal-dependent HD superfamily phosphohydrolase